MREKFPCLCCTTNPTDAVLCQVLVLDITKQALARALLGPLPVKRRDRRRNEQRVGLACCLEKEHSSDGFLGLRLQEPGDKACYPHLRVAAKQCRHVFGQSVGDGHERAHVWHCATRGKRLLVGLKSI